MHKEYMTRAIEIAKKGMGFVNPNPLVGAVIVKNNSIIGEGYHEIYGAPHAEVNAINSVTDSCEGATMYVSLEPCSHFGKTPPCADLIIEHKFKKVYIATLDPNPLVSGDGVKKLRDAGIEVEIGLLEEESKNINKVFFKWISEDEYPYVHLKFASTLDGKIALSNGNSQWISNSATLELSQFYRKKYSSIMVGINTLLNDNPRLNCRIDNGCDPYRIVVDAHLKTPIESNFIKMGKLDKKSIIITSKENLNNEKFILFKSLGINFITLPNFSFDIKEVFKAIKKFKIDSVMVEGGSFLISSIFKENLFDEGTIVIAPKFTGEDNAISFVHGFNPKTMNDSYNLPNVTFEILDDNFVVNFRR